MQSTVKVCPCGRHYRGPGVICPACRARELQELQELREPSPREVMQSLSCTAMNALRGGAVRIRMDERLSSGGCE
jgi:hypothetical protein